MKIAWNLMSGMALRKDAADFGTAQNRSSIGGGFDYYIPDVKTAIRKLFEEPSLP